MNHLESKEIDAIKKEIQEYINGVIKRNFTKAEKPWHPKGVMIFVDSENNLKKVTIFQLRSKNNESITSFSNKFYKEQLI